MTLLYEDEKIEITDSDVRLKGFHLPWKHKVIPYREIRSVERHEVNTAMAGGHVEFDLDTGHRSHAVIVPEDPDRVAALLHNLVPDVGR
jgi:hypothetical protein